MQASEAWLVGTVFTSVGALGSATALWFRSVDRRFKRKLVKAVGHVIAIDHHDSDGQTMYSPVVEYVADGRTYRVVDGVSYGKVRWQVGDAHDVRYDPGAPATAILHDSTGMRSGAELFGWVGGALLLSGLWLLACAELGIEGVIEK